MTSHDGRRFIVVIRASEVKKIFCWVLKHPTEETGGDLFGSWHERHNGLETNLNIHHAIGAGKFCLRTSFSFCQDVQYSSRIATYLSEHHGMDHVAVWHSHHTGLDQPSVPDENAIWNTMPPHAINRFALIIAVIHDKSNVALKCFLFEINEETNERLPVLQGKFRVLPEPFSPGDVSEAALEEGAESSLPTAEELASFHIIETEESVMGCRKKNVTEL